MKILTTLETAEFLTRLGLSLGAWRDLRSTGTKDPQWISHSPPVGADLLWSLSASVVSWLPVGDLLIQIDNSTSPLQGEDVLFSRLVSGSLTPWDVASDRSILLVREDKTSTDNTPDVVITAIIFFAILYQWHIHIVSSGCMRGQRVAIQDGVFYFYGDGVDLINFGK
jgi:hypothetical protein